MEIFLSLFLPVYILNIETQTDFQYQRHTLEVKVCLNSAAITPLVVYQVSSCTNYSIDSIRYSSPENTTNVHNSLRFVPDCMIAIYVETNISELYIGLPRN